MENTENSFTGVRGAQPLSRRRAAEELRRAPDAVRDALWKFTECGGSLLVIGAWEMQSGKALRREDPGD